MTDSRFRSTDAEVTKAYKSSPHPFGSVVSGDGFKRGFIRSVSLSPAWPVLDVTFERLETTSA